MQLPAGDDIEEVDSCSLPGLRSLSVWLLRHGRHVRRLALRFSGDDVEEQQLLAACLAACAAGGQLERLQLVADGLKLPLVFSAWAPVLRHLTQLELICDSGVEVTCSLHPLTALRKLKLVNGIRSLQLGPGVRLPAQLEQLTLQDRRAAAMPEQVRGHR